MISLGRPALRAAAGVIGPGGGVDAHPNDDDGGQRSIEASVAAAVESVAHGVSG